MPPRAHLRSRLLLSPLALLALLGTHGAQAQSVTPAWTITPQFNLTDPDSEWGIGKNPRGGGVRFGRTFSPTTELQLGVGSVRKSFNGTSYRQTLLGLEGLYKFNPGSVLRPFVSLGVGAERDKLSNPVGTATRTSPYASAGLGLQYWFTNNVALQVDARRVHGFLGDDGESAFGHRSSMNNVYGVGLVFGFGGTPPQPVRQAPPPEPPPTVVQAPEPMPAPPPPPPPPPPAPRFERVTLSATELFEFNKAELRMPQPRLDELAALLSTDTAIRSVTIEGHTDRIGSKAANQALSQRRADAVRDYLASKGVDRGRLEAVGLGSSRPVKVCEGKQYQRNKRALIECLAPNRRVEVLPVTGQRPLP